MVDDTPLCLRIQFHPINLGSEGRAEFGDVTLPIPQIVQKSLKCPSDIRLADLLGRLFELR